MAQIVVRNLDDDVKAHLKKLAARHGRSVEEEVREILRRAARASRQPVTRLGSRIAARFAGNGLSSELPELRGQEARATAFRR